MGTRQELGLLVLVGLLTLPAIWSGRQTAEPNTAARPCSRPVEVLLGPGPAQVICLEPGESAAALRPLARALPSDCPAPGRTPPGTRLVVSRPSGGKCQIEPVPMEGFRRILLGLGIDPNRASATELTILPGIGPVLAERIVAERMNTGDFQRTEDLLRVKGIGPKTLERIRPFLAMSIGGPN